MNQTPLLNRAVDWMERGLVPDPLIRWGIRRQCTARRRDETRRAGPDPRVAVHRFVAGMDASPIAPVPEKANEQHYEVPAAFFGHVLGRHRKYSCCLWEDGVDDLDQAEAAALATTCERAELHDGQDVLELGCGWGSLSLWMASRYPDSTITAVSNSRLQRHFIEGQATARGLDNLRVVTADMNAFDTDRVFDRVVSVEMFEHMRNYRRLLGNVARWMRPDGKLLVHIFCHRSLPYHFETDGAANWMGEHFFTGGIMPSADLLTRFRDVLEVTSQWEWNGRHYAHTAEAWLANLDNAHDLVLPVLGRTYGPDLAERWFNRWRVFFLACAELFAMRGGREWFVTHALLEPPS